MAHQPILRQRKAVSVSQCVQLFIAVFLLTQLPCFLCSVAEAGANSASRDMAEELSRQLEDILSTYCHEDGGVGGEDAAVTSGQPDGVEVNGLSEKEDGKQEEAKLNGNGCTEKDQKKLQDKKKVKGLGESMCLPERATPPTFGSLLMLFTLSDTVKQWQDNDNIMKFLF